jgi:hypothetical protein
VLELAVDVEKSEAAANSRILPPFLEAENGSYARVAVLDCRPDHDPSKFIGLYLAPLLDRSDVLFRFDTSPSISNMDVDAEDTAKTELRTVYLLKTDMAVEPGTPDTDRCWIRSVETIGCYYNLVRTSTTGSWDRGQRMMSVPQSSVDLAQIAFQSGTGAGFAVLLRFWPKEGKGELTRMHLDQRSAPPSGPVGELLTGKEEDLSDNSLTSQHRSMSLNGRGVDARVLRAVDAWISILKIRGKMMFVVDLRIKKKRSRHDRKRQ